MVYLLISWLLPLFALAQKGQLPIYPTVVLKWSPLDRIFIRELWEISVEVPRQDNSIQLTLGYSEPHADDNDAYTTSAFDIYRNGRIQAEYRHYTGRYNRSIQTEAPLGRYRAIGLSYYWNRGFDIFDKREISKCTFALYYKIGKQAHFSWAPRLVLDYFLGAGLAFHSPALELQKIDGPPRTYWLFPITPDVRAGIRVGYVF